MEFTFLGTSAGVPTLQRNVSGLVIKQANSKSWCLVDCGEGTQHQLLRLPHSLVQLDTILITHVHGDHCFGLPGLLATASMAGRKQALTIVAPHGVEEFVRATFTFTDVSLSYPLNFVLSDALGVYVEAKGFSITSVILSHRVASYAYRFEEVPSCPNLDSKKLIAYGVPPGEAWGQLIKNGQIELNDGQQLRLQDYVLPQRPSRAVIVGGDNDTPDLIHTAARGAQVLIHEATYSQEVGQKVGPWPQHSTAASVAESAQRMDIKNLVLTHFSARYHHHDQSRRMSIGELKREAQQHYRGNLFLANDFDKYVLNLEGDLYLSD
ncbi:MAG: ribonuclease Z [Lentisphaeria bacterium]